MQNSISFQPIEDGLIELLSVLEPKQTDFKPYLHHTALVEACRLVANASHITFIEPRETLTETQTVLAELEIIAENSKYRIRAEQLKANWWKEDCGPLLCFREADERPMALLFEKNHYFWLDENGTEQIVTTEFAERLSQTAYRFYRSLPAKVLHWRDLLKFAFIDCFSDFKRILLLQSCIGLLALTLPIFTGFIFENIIPNADTNHLMQTIFMLLIIAIISTVFGVVEGIGLIRFRLKATVSMQASIWDRLLRLPLSFFKKYTAGDLAQRLSGIDTIQGHLTESSLISILSGTFSIFSLGLMFFYDVYLALAATALTILAIIITIFFDLSQLKYQRLFMELQGKITGIIYSLLTSINKIRVANREGNAFSIWSSVFSEKTKMSLKAQTNVMWYDLFYPLFIILATALLFILVLWRGKNLSFGDFIAFNVAFGQFFAAVLSMASVITRSISIIPIYERMKPILNTLPEVETEGITIDNFQNQIELQEISFNYPEQSTTLFDGLSLTIPKNAFVAFVGTTGSGKSSLLRLLLKFENPTQGNLFYDGHDLAFINISALRKQMGVVLQNSSLLSTSIYENITGLSPNLTMEDAWAAAELMQIAKEIREMPMGMYTLLAENGKNISVGQKQRIMLARAIVHKPSLLILDEATNALDYKTENLVAENLTKLNCTRIVASHRINAIKKADYIYVLEEGKIVQSGSYNELLRQKGLFATLAKRQNV